MTKMISDKDDMTTTLTPTESEDQFLHSNTHKDYVFIALFGLRWTDRPHHEEEEVTVWSRSSSIFMRGSEKRRPPS